MVALAGALPTTLEQLDLRDAGCGDDGFVALAAALPALPRLRTLDCGSNPAVGDRGWVALAGALPSAAALQQLSASSSRRAAHTLGAEGAAALAAALPHCASLRTLNLAHVNMPNPTHGRLLAWYHSLAGGEKRLKTHRVYFSG